MLYGALVKGLNSDAPEWGARLGLGWAWEFRR
jgi:hypothetical protein